MFAIYNSWLIDLIDLVFNATFSNISAISWRPGLVVEKAGVPGENHRPWARTGKLYYLRLRVECTIFVIYKAGHEPTPSSTCLLGNIFYSWETHFRGYQCSNPINSCKNPTKYICPFTYGDISNIYNTKRGVRGLVPWN